MRLISTSGVLLLLGAGLGAALWLSAQQAGQITFASPQAAAAALNQDIESNNETALLQLFGSSGKDLVASGDAAQDAHDRRQFITAYAQMHRLVREPDGAVTLYTGAENWPFPVPLAEAQGKWYFDTTAGSREVVYRRIGHNEDAAIQVLQELVAAQKEYYAQPHDGQAVHQYAQHIISSPGRHDGLFWDGGSGQPQSQIGSLVAFASLEAQGKAAQQARPYEGYYYHLIKSPSGFAFIAWPAEYRSSGVFSFLVGPDGVVYQKNLGPDSATQAKAIAGYNTAGWGKADQ